MRTKMLTLFIAFIWVLAFPLKNEAQITILDSITCNGDTSGQVIANPTYGTAPYTYLWSTGDTTAQINNLAAGVYSVTITDSLSVDSISTAILTEPALLQVSIVPTGVICFSGNDGTANANVAGGTLPYTYMWSTSDTTSSIANLVAGNYFVTVTDANGCTATNSITITEPQFPIGITISPTNVLCFGGNDGSAEITDISGDNGPVTFLWSNGATTPSISNLFAGIYSVTVTDANGCSGSGSITITEPAQLTVSVAALTPSACDGFNNGGVSINVAGGIAPYSFFWRELTSDSVYFTQNLSNVRGGNYSVTVTDANGCIAVDTISIPNDSIVSVITTVDEYVCNGTLGGVTVQAVNADSAQYYLYEWNSMYNTSSFVSNDSVFNASTSFLPGSYIITTTELATGCQNYFDFVITESATAVSTSETITPNLCFGDAIASITVTALGGDPLPAAQCVWSGPGVTGLMGFSVSGLISGNYTYVVTDDSAQCTVRKTVTIPTIPLLQGHLTPTDVACNGVNSGQIEASFSGGTGFIHYLWSTSDTTAVINNLSAGNYSLTVSDENNCSVISATTITQPGAISIILNSMNDVSCNGYSDGNISLTVSGGSGNLNYSWIHDTALTSYVTEDLMNICAGIWEIIVTDGNGCSANFSVTINEPTATFFTDSVHVVSCNNGADGFWGITPTGTYGPYVFIFSTGDTISTDTIPSPGISGLNAGTYSVDVFASNGCSWNFQQTFVQPLQVTADFSYLDDTECFNGSTGQLTVGEVHGGTSPYTFLWSNGMTTQTIVNIPAGIYMVTITDANGCQITMAEEVGGPVDSIRINPTAIGTSCFQADDGKIILYSDDILFSPNNTNIFSLYFEGNLVKSVLPGEIIDSLSPGTYIGILTNQYGCSSSPKSIQVERDPENCMIIPNVVTSNEDGFNDVFAIQGACEYDLFSVKIYTDWGNLVFKSDDCNFIWDPRDNEATAGSVYYCVISVTDDNESSTQNSNINILK